MLKDLAIACGVKSCRDKITVTPFISAEDGSEYSVWRVKTENDTFVLKLAKPKELAVYRTFLSEGIYGAPRLLGYTRADSGEYLLMEYAEGEDMTVCSRASLKAALDALIGLQKRYWGLELECPEYSFGYTLERRRERGKYLYDPELDLAYAKYLELYERLPRTLCHDDLLPFNLRISDTGATIIDWECAGMLPYPTSLARLLAHGDEDSELFRMSDADREYAINYYYDGLLRDRGISYTEYRQAMELFFLYEYCEWIMLGNKYPTEADMERYNQYLAKDKAQLRKIK